MNARLTPSSKKGMSPLRTALSFGLVAVLALSPVSALALGVGQRAPEIELRALDGSQVALSSLRGKVVLVDFWATWCSPCRDELPHLQRLYREYQARGFVVIGVSVDRDADNVASFVRRLGLTFPIVHDAAQAVAGRYHPTTMPTSFLVDRDGVVRFVHEGFRNADVAEFEREIRSLLGN